MDETVSTLMFIIGPLVLLGLLFWAATRSKRAKRGDVSKATTERATDANYDREEQRRRDGTDGL